MSHTFGGPWTHQKLKILEAYLMAYITIFEQNERARYFRRTYVDAFAGSGTIADRATSSPYLIDPEADPEFQELHKGSVRLALDLEPGFHEYMFIERNAGRAQQLEELVSTLPRHKRAAVLRGDANTELREWARRTNWDKRRAVVFLDPYGMQVEWDTITALAQTEAVDLWLLFPVGIGVNRLLTQSIPNEAWARRLTLMFGNDEWRQEFYRAPPQGTLFGGGAEPERVAHWEQVERYFLERLATVFASVAPVPRRLYNSTNAAPLYSLFFASANPKGAPTALRIAKHLLENF